MRISHVGDLHITSRPSRSDCSLEEQREILRWIVADIEAQQCDLALVAGDIFDRKDTTAEERQAAVYFLRGLPTFVMISGNHDNNKDLLLVHAASVMSTSSQYQTMAEVGEFYGITLASIPWPRRDPNVTAEGTKAALRSVLDSIKGCFQGCDKPKILVAHLDTMGAKFDGGQDNTGKVDISIDPHDLADLGADYVALGHYHRRQEVVPGVRYCGSIRQQRFGDDPAKGYLIYDTETQEVTERNAPSRKLWTENWTVNEKGIFGPCSHPLLKHGSGDIVRVRYDVSEHVAATAREQIEKLGAENWKGCQVIIEPRVIASSAVRSDKITVAKTPAEKLEAYWGATKRPEVSAAVRMGKKLAEVLP